MISFHNGDVLTGTEGLLLEIFASIGKSIGLSPCISLNCTLLKVSIEEISTLNYILSKCIIISLNQNI